MEHNEFVAPDGWYVTTLDKVAAGQAVKLSVDSVEWFPPTDATSSTYLVLAQRCSNRTVTVKVSDLELVLRTGPSTPGSPKSKAQQACWQACRQALLAEGNK